jgi:hypothetical protein
MRQIKAQIKQLEDELKALKAQLKRQKTPPRGLWGAIEARGGLPPNRNPAFNTPGIPMMNEESITRFGFGERHRSRPR